MSFTSPIFLAFVIGISMLYYLPVLRKFQWLTLLGASYFFYYTLSPSTFLYIITTTITTFIGGILLEHFMTTKASLKSVKRLFVGGTLLINFGILLLIKYLNFIVEGLSQLPPLSQALSFYEPVNLLVPLGISFYTFQSVSYVIDIGRKKHPASRHLLKFAVFVSYFPQLIQGPISKFGELYEPLTTEKHLDLDRIKTGVLYITLGFFKKLIIADRMAVIVHGILDNYLDYSGTTLFAVIFCYCIQLYADFSGGIDIALGVSEFFGITLTPNFKQPFFATSIDDYWRRWHMSLGRWMKDYLFYPLSLSRTFAKLGKFSRKHMPKHLGRVFPTMIATIITFEAVGIWQGPGFQNIAYGFYNGIMIAISMLLDPFKKKRLKAIKGTKLETLYNTFTVLLTIVLINFGRYFSRASSLSMSIDLYKKTFTEWDFSMLFLSDLASAGLGHTDIVIMCIGIVVLFIVDFIHEKDIKVSDLLGRQHQVVEFAVLFTIVGIIFLFGILEQSFIPTEFIYRGV